MYDDLHDSFYGFRYSSNEKFVWIMNVVWQRCGSMVLGYLLGTEPRSIATNNNEHVFQFFS
jgi:hypothetical protein